ncbi:LOW QUALITY PROTEIN: paternally-expressed gene 3 protein [Camelus ferus]|uniref:Paternally-expressed gene 3 protein n=1 Tax=Camelus ferus TaxID=419612 RepID=A0A8B8TMP4_CAMFR|nr:LOW QUALITY PROTEIN: paternally-expressed gene 3 protein [Camelus ferus]
MLPPKYLSATKPRRSWAPDLRGLDGALSGEPDAALGEGAADSEFFHQRFRNFLYVEFAGPRKTLLKLRNLCLDWLQPETRTKEEIIELLVLEQYLTILPEKIKPWVRAKKPENCEKLVSLLENYKEMYEPEDDSSSDVHSDSSMSRNAAESPPRAAYSFRGDRDRDWDQDWDRDRDQDWDLEQDRVRDREHRRGRSRDLESRGRWPYARNPRSRFPQRDLSLPLTEQSTLAEEGEHRRRDSLLDCEAGPQDAVSYQDVVDLAEDRQPQNPVQDNMENYRKLLSLGVQLAEDDGHSHMTQGHSSRSKRSAYPSSSRGLKTMPETKKSTHRRGICEDESSHGVIMEKFIRDVPRSPKSGRARGPGDRVQRFSRRADSGWKDVPFSKRESVIQERGYEGSAFGGGGFNFNSNLVSRKRVLERKRRYHFDTDGKGSVHNQKGCARKRPFECSEVRRAVSMSSLSAPPLPDSQPFDLGAMPYVCDECGRPFSVISEFVEHQIMHTRESLYEYGESFLHSVAVSEVRRRQVGGKRFECKECGETFNKSAALAEHRQGHSRGRLAGGADEECEEPFMASPTFRELQKIYGKDKFYECRVCGETFLHSSALVEHQQVHGRGGREDGRREARRPVPALGELPKTRGSERRYECRVCGEAFLHGAALRGHQRAHAHSPLSSQGRGREEAFTPGPSLKKRQKTYSREKPYDFKDPGEAFKRQSPGLTELQKIHSRKNLYEGRGCPKSAIHSAPFPEPQKSHTITRPPEDEEAGSAFAVSASPADRQEALCRARKPYERSVIHSLSFAGAQKSHSAAGPATPEVVPESPLQGSGVIRRPKVLAREGITERKRHETSVIHSLATFRPPRSCSGSEVTGRDERGESSAYLPDLRGQQQKTPARENPYRGSKTPSFTESVIHSVSHSEPRTSLAGEGSSGFKKDGEPSGPSSGVREHQKARAKKKNIEQRNYETSVIHSLRFGDPQTFRPREKFYECPECGESFVRSSDLTEHQKIHDRKKPSGSKSYMRSVIRTLASTDPQTSYADQPAQTSYADQPAQTSCADQPAQTSYAEPPAQTSYADQPAQASYADQPAQTSYADQPAQTSYADQPAQASYADQPAQTSYADQPAQTSYAEPPAQTSYADQLAQTSYAEPPAQASYADQPAQTSYTDQPAQTSCADQPAQASYADQPAQTSYADQPAQASYADQPAQASYTDQPAQASYADQPAQASYADQPAQTSYAEPPAQTSYTDQLAQTSYADQPAQTSYVDQPMRNECKDCGECFATTEDLGAHQKIYAQEKFHSGKLFGDSVIQGVSLDGPQQEEPRQDEPEEPEEPDDEQEEAEDSIYGCKDCGLGFADRADLRDHQRVHGREYVVDSREHTRSVSHAHPFGELQKDYLGEQLYECPACGESFVHSSFLFEHQRVHEQDQFYGRQRYDEPFVQPLVISPPRPRVPQKSPPAGLSLQCQVCGRDFIHGSVLSQHVSVHTAEGLPERGQRSRGAVGAGSALAELQRDPAEERRYQCETCGESFPSPSDLREHVKAHESEEPYDYGAAFVHTSFLTEPPKGDSPFYECKDCGKSFLHSTVLTKHQKLHAEEEEAAAAAQEVEANVLVPREVLRIQGSNVEAAEPEVEAAEPEVEAAEPNVEAAEPNGEAEGPDGEAAEPNGEAEQPNGEAEQPNGDADEPDGAGIEDPEERAEEPEGDADEPDGAGVEDPEEEVEDPEIQVEEPYYDCRECGETFTSSVAYGEHLKTHARVIIFEAGNVCGESSHYTEHASTSTGDSGRADDKHFTCDVCGQVFGDRLSLARHQNTHTG